MKMIGDELRIPCNPAIDGCNMRPKRKACLGRGIQARTSSRAEAADQAVFFDGRNQAEAGQGVAREMFVQWHDRVEADYLGRQNQPVLSPAVQRRQTAVTRVRADPLDTDPASRSVQSRP